MAIIISVLNILNAGAAHSSLQPNSEIIDSNKWPAVKLAAKRSPKAIGLEKLLTSSMATNKGDMYKGAPGGKNCEKKFNLKLEKPYTITPNHRLKAIPNVTDIWVVVGKANKKNPKQLINKINKNKESNGRLKYLLSKFSLTWLSQCSINNSVKFWNLVGTK